MNDVMNQHRNVCAFSEQQLIQERNQSVSDKANLEQLIASLPLCRQSDYQVDCKGKPLALFMKGGLAWPWSQADATKLLKIPLEATLALAKAYPPPNIRDGDKRHLDAKAERIRCEELSRPHGVYHLGARR